VGSPDPLTNTVATKSVPKVKWDSQSKNNLLASCYLWSMSGFVTYLVMYYSKYFEGNFFVNYCLQGFSDALALIYVNFLSNKFDSGPDNLVKTLKFLVCTLMMLTCLQLFVTYSTLFSVNLQGYIVPIMILLIRL
jgi:hypothetical protein